MHYLLFQSYAPLVSWGDIAVGGERQSFRHPSKSAVIGLLAAALGIRREHDQKLNQLTDSVGFAVKMLSGGTVLKDFHTAQLPGSERKVVYHTRRDELSAPKEIIGTVLSRREYRCDAFSVIAIWLKDNAFTLDDIAKALRYPEFQLYFGRKSCPPAVPLSPVLVQADTLKEAFNSYTVNLPVPVKETEPDWRKAQVSDYQEKVLKDAATVTYFWEKCENSGFQETHKTSRYDLPCSRKRWQFTMREEFMAVESCKEVPDVSQ